jgi:hypothetical protein
MQNEDAVAIGQWALLTAHVSGAPPQPVGIVLCDVQQNELHIRMRSNWSSMVRDGTAEIWHHIEEDIVEKVHEEGASQVLNSTVSEQVAV